MNMKHIILALATVMLIGSFAGPAMASNNINKNEPNPLCMQPRLLLRGTMKVNAKNYLAVLANKMKDPLTVNTKIVGKSCESGDVLIENVMLPKLTGGDTLAVFSTGAYNYSTASNYNQLPIPGVLLVKDGQQEWIVKPQGMKDVVQNDIVPDRLK